MRRNGFAELLFTRPNVALTLLLGILVGYLASTYVAGPIVEKVYGNIRESHAQDPGSKATEDTPIAKSIDDVLKYESFAIQVDDYDHPFFDGDYYVEDALTTTHYYNIRLESGERIAVKCDYNSANKMPDGTLLMRVGSVVEEDLTQNAKLMEDIEEEYPLDRTDFYVNSTTDFSKTSKYSTHKESNTLELVKGATWFIVALVVWIVTHVMCVKAGWAAPLLFSPKEKKK